MAKKKNKHKQHPNHSQKGKDVNWDLVWKVLASIFAFAGSLATVYDLVDKVRSDAQTFYSYILPGLASIIWVIVLAQLFRKKNPYVILLLAVTVLGGVAGGIGWRSYNQGQEDKVIVLVAQFDGPEETYGLGRQIIDDLQESTKDYDDIVIVEGSKVITSRELARKLGGDENADLVIWAWYRPTENPNVTIHIEILSQQFTTYIDESTTSQPVATLADLESFSLQQRIGGEATALVKYLVGLIQYQASDYSAALPFFLESLATLDSSTPSLIDYQDSLYFYLGTTYYNLNQYDQAIADFSTAIQLDPQYASAYNNRGIIYGQLNQYDLSISDLSIAIKMNSEDPVAYNNRGIAYRKIKQYDLSIADYSKAIELDVQYADAYYNRGITYADLNQYELALADFSTAIKLNPQFTIAYYSRGNAYADLNQYELALADFSTAIKLNPQSADAYNNRAMVYVDLGQYNQAIADLSTAIQLDPLASDGYTNRGAVYAILEQYDVAIADFSYAIQLDSQFASAYQNRSKAYQLIGKTKEAEADLRKYKELTGQEP